LIELLRRADAGQAAVITGETTTSYGKLAADAEAVGAALADRGITRFAVLDHDAATVAALLAGAAQAGAEACQYPPDSDPHGVSTLAARFDHHVLVTARHELEHELKVIDPAQFMGQDVTGSPTSPPASRPLLTLTTGTTGTPRGVRQDWDRLLRTVRRVEPSPDQRWLLAYG
jgi:acyl-CoA synthetase (AMP-forming)/AMP-acid ligase II